MRLGILKHSQAIPIPRLRLQNETCVVQHAIIEDHRILLTSDIGPGGLNEAADYAYSLGLLKPPHFVQVPHHGSRRNVTPAVLDRGSALGWQEAWCSALHIARSATTSPTIRAAKSRTPFNAVAIRYTSHVEGPEANLAAVNSAQVGIGPLPSPLPTGLKSDVVLQIRRRLHAAARLLPAVIAAAPALAAFALLISWQKIALSNMVATGALLVLLFALADFARKQGLRVEPKIYKEMGGKPSVTMMRRTGDATLDANTKEKYRTFLAGKVKHPAPTAEMEAAN